MREVKFASVDFDLFDKDITPSDYEFFKKHTDTFKRLLEDQSTQQKLDFIQAFRVFALKDGCIRKLGKGYDTSKYVNETMQYYEDNFAHGKFSTAKMLVNDSVCLAQNRPLLQHIGTHSHTKDPFCHKDSRDTFRRLFGHPSEERACMKVLVELPMHLKFGGALCRYLRRWLDTDDTPEDQKMPSERINTKTSEGATSSSSKPKKGSSDDGSRSSTQDQKSKKKKSSAGAKAKEAKAAPVKDKKSHSESTESKDSKQSDETKGSQKDAPKKDRNYVPFGVIHVDGAAKTTSFSSLFNEDTDSDTLRETANALRMLRELEENEEDDESSSCVGLYKFEQDGSLKKLRDGFHLGKPHPNEIFENRCKEREEMAKKAAEDRKIKRHTCANCRKVEVTPKSYKKCQLCKGKGTRFYCGRDCQAEDWTTRHRQDHERESVK